MTDKTTFEAGSTLPEILESAGLEDPVAFITRFTSALMTAIGFPGRTIPVTDTPQHQWAEEKLIPDSTLVDGAQTAGDTTIEVTTGTGLRFRAKDIVAVNGSRELMSVTTPSADSLLVVRGIRATTAEAILDGATLELINNPALESGAAKSARPTTLTRKDNFTELFDDTASVTRSMRDSKNIGAVGDQLDHQVLRVQQDLMRRIARTFVQGKRQSSDPEGTLTTARTMDGIIHFILGGADAATLDALGKVLDEDLLNQVLEDAFSKGGSPNLIAASPKQKRAISRLMEGRTRFRGEDTVLGVVVERFISDFGMLDVMEPDIFIPDDVLLILDRSRLRPARHGDRGTPFLVEELSKTGHVDNRLISIELTLEIKNATDGGHALIQNLAVA